MRVPPLYALAALLFLSFAGVVAFEGDCGTNDLDFAGEADSSPGLSLLQTSASLSKANSKFSRATSTWGMYDALQLFQQARSTCHTEACQKDQSTILTIFLFLVVSIGLVLTAFLFFREDKEEQVTPLCPQLVVRDAALTFKLSLDPLAESSVVLNKNDPNHIIAKVAMDWPDPFQPCASGIASTARLQNAAGMNLATVVARNVAVSGQALALCRSGCEIFGFVEPDSVTRYHVRHRTGVHLLTLVGDFSTWQVEGVNPAGAVVFSATKEGDCIVGKVQQHVDAGLLICCLVAAHIHRGLQQPPCGAQRMASPGPCIASPHGQPVLTDERITDEEVEDEEEEALENSSSWNSPACLPSSEAAAEGKALENNSSQSDLYRAPSPEAAAGRLLRAASELSDSRQLSPERRRSSSPEMRISPQLPDRGG